MWQEAAIELSSYVRQAGLDGIWEVPPVYDGQALRNVLPSLPFGPAFREVRGEAQSDTRLAMCRTAMVGMPPYGVDRVKQTLSVLAPKIYQFRSVQEI
jgi:hypothetical protein